MTVPKAQPSAGSQHVTSTHPVPAATVRGDAVAVAFGLVGVVALALLWRVPGPVHWLAPFGLSVAVGWLSVQAVRLRDARDLAVSHLETTRAGSVRVAYLARATSEAVVMHDGSTICDVNESFTEIFGYQPEDVAGKPLLDLIEPEAKPLVRDKLDTRSPDTLYQIGGVTSDGSCVSLEIRPWTMFHDDGVVRAWAIRDVSEYRRIERALQESERQLRHAQKMEAVGMLAAGVAHDFNNLLTVINGHCDLLRLDLDHGDPTLEEVEEIHDAARSAASLTRQLLAFSRKQVQQLEVLDLGAIIHDLSRMLQRLLPENITLTVIAQDAVSGVMADRGQLEQVIINLAVNARDAMPDGGTLTIAAADAVLDEEAAARRPGARAGDYVLLNVRDTGTGIPGDIQSKIFDPFFTTKKPGKGTGLGLSTVFGIVKQTGGYVDLDSETGVGTCFSIYLPRTNKTAPSTEPWVETHRAPTRGATVLLVEDARPVRELTTVLLQRNGYTVIAADTGAQAVELAGSFTGTIDLLVADVVMPAMSGPAVAEIVRESRPDTKVLYMSGYAADVLVEHGLRQPALLLEKPFGADSLLVRVRDALDERHRSSGVYSAP